jgi:chitinase
MLKQPETTSPSPSTPPRGVKGGYWPSWRAEKFPPSAIPTSYFTHLFYAFVVPDANSFQLLITQTDDQWMGNFTATLHAKTPQAKAFLSIGGGTASPNTFSNMASNPDSRAAFINSTISVARKYGFDGLDFDWEFPNTPQDMSNLSLLFKEWHEAIENESSISGKSKLFLSAAVYFASSFFLSNIPRTYPIEAINKYVDFVSPMCYDYRGSWDTAVTGEHALLYDKASSINTSYGISSWIKAGVSPEKLVMGLPLYGRTWQLKSSSDNGIGAPAVGTGPGNDGIMIYTDIEDFNVANDAAVVFDAQTVSTYSHAGTNWIGYDGPQSIEKKVEFARAQGLAGYFFWALGYDKNWTLSNIGRLFMSTSLFIRRKFHNLFIFYYDFNL